MCLITKHPAQIQTAKEDIVVYKLVEDVNGIFYGPFQWIHYGNPKHLPFLVREDGTFTIYPYNSYKDKDCVSEGGFHSFESLDDLKSFKFDRAYTDDYKIVKCIIPKGTKYIKGEFKNFDRFKNTIYYPSYISKWLKFEEVCA